MLSISISDEQFEQILSIFKKAIREEMEAVSRLQWESKLLSPDEACNIFVPKISKVTLNRWTKEGWLCCQKIGGRVYYKRGDILNAGTSLKKYKSYENELLSKKA